MAADYAARFLGELARKPLDRALLEIVADQAVPLAPVADVGCGPGHVTGLSFHLGDELRHLDEFWGHPVSLDFQFYDRSVVEPALVAAGLVVDAYVERRPYEHEVDTTRAYLMGHRPS